MPTRRNGSNTSQASGHSTSANSASGQHSTNNTHQASRAIRVFMVGPPVERHRCTRSNHHRAGSGRRPQAGCDETPDAATEPGFPRARPGDSRPDSASTHVAKLERSEEHTSELQSTMRHTYAVFCLQKKNETII